MGKTHKQVVVGKAVYQIVGLFRSLSFRDSFIWRQFFYRLPKIASAKVAESAYLRSELDDKPRPKRVVTTPKGDRTRSK